MSNFKKFLIGGLITLAIAIGLLYWSYRLSVERGSSPISPIAIILIEFLVLQILARVFPFKRKFEKQDTNGTEEKK
jgi:hypothetical protein